MLAYIIRRVLLAVPTLFGISVLSFVIMHLPPGDFLTTYASILSQQGEGIATEQLEQLRRRHVITNVGITDPRRHPGCPRRGSQQRCLADAKSPAKRKNCTRSIRRRIRNIDIGVV